MTAPSTVCPACGEDVPFGRRTCEACGANVTTAAAPSESASDHDIVAAETGTEGPRDVAAEPATTDATGWDLRPAAPYQPAVDEPAVTMAAPYQPAVDEPAVSNAAEQAAEAVSANAAAPAVEAGPAPELQPAAAPFIPPVLREWNPGSPLPETGFAAELAAAEAEPAGLAGAWLPPSATPSATPAMPPPVAYRAADTPSIAPPSHDASPPADTGAAAAPPGAMPATLAAMLNRTSTGAPRWPGAQSATSEAASQTGLAPAGPLTPPSRMPDLAREVSRTDVAPPTQRPLEPGRAPLFADLPFDAPNTLPGWLVAGGGALATVSFLLPWVAVIDSYFTAWGLGSISNLPAFLVVFGTTALAILPSRLADWLRHGILGLTVGSFILGLTWNRLVGASGGQIGVILEGTGALLLLIGGILAIVRDRGADGPDERR